MLGVYRGGCNRIGSIDDEGGASLVMYGSRVVLLISIVPPWAFDLRNGSSGSNTSLEFNLKV